MENRTSAGNITVEAIVSFDEFLKLEVAWNELAVKAGDNFFLRHEWFRSWWTGFGLGSGLLILLLKENGALTGIAPLMVKKSVYRKITVREIKFMQNDNSPRADFILAGDRLSSLGAIFGYLHSIGDKWDIVRLTDIPHDSPNYGALKGILEKSRVFFGIKTGLASPFIRIGGTWDEYLKDRTSKYQQVIRNKLSRIKKAGLVEVEVISDTAANGDILRQIGEISANSWKAQFGKDIYNSEENKSFFNELSRVSSVNNWLRIWLLKLGGLPVAYEYHIVYNNRDYALRCDFDENYKKYSPGSVLDINIIKQNFINHMEEYDMCGDNDHYKMNWTVLLKLHDRFIVYKKNIMGFMLYFVEFVFIENIKSVLGFLRAFRQKTAPVEIKNTFGVFYRSRLMDKIKGTGSFIFNLDKASLFECKIDGKLDFKAGLPFTVDMYSGVNSILWLEEQNISWLIDRKEITTGLKQHHYYPAVLYNGKIVGVLKVGIDRTYVSDFNRSFSFPSTMAFIYDTFIHPDFRGKGAAPFLISETLKFLKKRGFTSVRCHIPVWNRASVNTYTKVNFRKIENFSILSIMGVKFFSADITKG